MPWFGLAEAALALIIAWRWMSFPALLGAIAVMATMSLRMLPDGFAPMASAIWATAGLVLINRGNLVTGSLYGCSGIVYLAIYAGFQDVRLAPVHLLSDGIFLLALALVAGGGRRAIRGSNRRRGFHMGRSSQGEIDMAGRTGKGWMP